MIKLGTRNIGRASALLFGIAAVTAACGDNGVTPPDAAPDAPPAPAVLAMTPMTNSFGSVTVGATSAAASFTVSNTGGSTSGTITPILTGTGAGEFAFQNGCSTLAPGGTCTITASFKPTAAGGKTAALVVSGSPGGSVMANLDGSGVAVGSLTLAPGSQSFGTQTVNVAVTTNDKIFVVTNGGGTASGALTVTAAGSDPGEFTKTADTCSGQMIAAAATCSITIRFAPLSSGSKSASFDIVGNPGGTLHAAVSGNAVTGAALSVTPSVQDFGTVVVGGNTPIVFTVTNTGGVTSGAIANTLSGAGAASFSIANSSCTGATLTPGNTCNITVRLNGTTAGTKNAQLDVTGTPGGTDSSLLTGNVVDPGSIIPSPGTIAFGPITVGQNSGAQTITISNTGGATTGALTTALGGANAGDFNVIAGGNSCQGATLAPAGTCQISVRFSPATAGNAKAATMTVIGAPGGTAITSLSGDGIIAAQLQFNPLSKDFGSVTNGTQSATQTFTITNIGGQTSGAVTPALTGANAAEFSIMNTTCAAGLAPAASCDVLVFFKPTTSGAKVAAVSVTGASAPLSGAGISPSQITANPTSLTFAGNTLIGTSSLVQSFTVTNNGSTTTGTIAVTIGGVNAGDYSQTNNCTTLIANATCQVTVTFTPTAAGARVATVTVTEGTNSVGVAVSGTGQRKLEILVPNINPFDFGNVDDLGLQLQSVPGDPGPQQHGVAGHARHRGPDERHVRRRHRRARGLRLRQRLRRRLHLRRSAPGRWPGVHAGPDPPGGSDLLDVGHRLARRPRRGHGVHPLRHRRGDHGSRRLDRDLQRGRLHELARDLALHRW
ncbi:MAG: choice-of-anchor D domain-containing protein [Myxococcales bacterium]|nr:choice-of-anchor D domain-containing protein [Myxococcales bacterium]